MRRWPWTVSTDAVQLVNCSKSQDRKQQSSCDQWLWQIVTIYQVWSKYLQPLFSKDCEQTDRQTDRRTSWQTALNVLLEAGLPQASITTYSDDPSRALQRTEQLVGNVRLLIRHLDLTFQLRQVKVIYDVLDAWCQRHGAPINLSMWLRRQNPVWRALTHPTNKLLSLSLSVSLSYTSVIRPWWKSVFTG